MAISTCPTTVARASAERIWSLLVTPERVAEWTGTRLVEAPHATMEVGDQVVFCPGPGLRAIFEVKQLVPPTTYSVDVYLHWGIVNHEVVRVVPVGDGSCRVTFG